MCCGVQKRTAYTNCEDVQTVTYPLHIEQFVLVWGCLHWSVQHAQTNVSCDIWNTEIFFIDDHKCYWVWRGVSCVFFTHTRTHTHQVPVPNCTALSLAILCCVITAVTIILFYFLLIFWRTAKWWMYSSSIVGCVIIMVTRTLPYFGKVGLLTTLLCLAAPVTYFAISSHF